MDASFLKKEGKKQQKGRTAGENDSLSASTKRFAKLLYETNGPIDFINACEELSISQRRIYDIIGTLEGAGMITRLHPRIIEIKKFKTGGLINDVRILKSQEGMLDQLIQNMEKSLSSQKKENEKDLYVSHKDLKKVLDSTKCSIVVETGHNAQMQKFKPGPKGETQIPAYYLCDEGFKFVPCKTKAKVRETATYDTYSALPSENRFPSGGFKIQDQPLPPGMAPPMDDNASCTFSSPAETNNYGLCRDSFSIEPQSPILSTEDYIYVLAETEGMTDSLDFIFNDLPDSV